MARKLAPAFRGRNKKIQPVASVFYVIFPADARVAGGRDPGIRPAFRTCLKRNAGIGSSHREVRFPLFPLYAVRGRGYKTSSNIEVKTLVLMESHETGPGRFGRLLTVGEVATRSGVAVSTLHF